jgi:hypothetical protein
MSQPAATTFFMASSSMTAVRCSPAPPSHCDIWFSVWAMHSSSASARLGYGEPPPATLTENESVARPAPPRHSSKPDSTLIRYQEGWM